MKITHEIISEVIPREQWVDRSDKPKPAAPTAPPKKQNANDVALQTAIDNAKKFRQERDTALTEVERLKKENQRLIGEMEQRNRKTLSDASEAEIQRACALLGIR